MKINARRGNKNGKKRGDFKKRGWAFKHTRWKGGNGIATYVNMVKKRAEEKRRKKKACDRVKIDH